MPYTRPRTATPSIRPVTKPDPGLAAVIRQPALAHRLTPHDVMQIQRLAGNRAVGQLLQRKATGGSDRGSQLPRIDPPPAARASEIDAANRPSIQRTLDFRFSELQAGGGKPSRAASFGTKTSSYTAIYIALERYEAIIVPPASRTGTKEWELRTQAKKDRVDWLRIMYTNSKKFLKHNSKDKGKETRVETIERLLAAVTRELVFSGAFNVGSTSSKEFKSISNATLTSTSASKFSSVKLARRQLAGAPSPDEIRAVMASLEEGEDELLKSFRRIKDKRGLTSQEVKALYTYTDDQYQLMNPAAAQNPDWFEAAMTGQGKNVSREKLEEAYQINRMISEVAASGLGKLLPWSHTGTIYRGETVPVDEARALEWGAAGFGRAFPHLVSTSQGTATPLKECLKNKTAARPYQVIYHIVASTGGRDVAALAKSQNEAEIIFLPGTWFRKVELISNDTANQIMHVKVQADGPS